MVQGVVRGVNAVRLHLGCGGKLLKEFINVDLPNNWSDTKPDVEADVTKRLPFADGYADEILAVHVLEHLNRWDLPAVLKEWTRVLKPGGLMVVELPCLDKILSLYAHAMIDGNDPDPRLTIMGLYGDPSYKNEHMMHRWCYSVAELAVALEKIGLEEIRHEVPQHHQPARDMRFTARKPNGHKLFVP